MKRAFPQKFHEKNLISLLTRPVKENRYGEKQHFHPRDVLEKRNGTKVDRQRSQKKCCLSESEQTMTKRARKKDVEREALGQKVCLWCDSFLCSTRMSFCPTVCHQLRLVTWCVCVCEGGKVPYIYPQLLTKTQYRLSELQAPLLDFLSTSHTCVRFSSSFFFSPK